MEVARIWRQRRQRYSLEGATCIHCGAPQFPARLVCQQCGGLTGVESLSNGTEINLPMAIRIPEKAELPQMRG